MTTYIRHLLTKSGNDPLILAEQDVSGTGQSLSFEDFLEKKIFLRASNDVTTFRTY